MQTFNDQVNVRNVHNEEDQMRAVALKEEYRFHPLEKRNFAEEAEPWIQRGQLGFFTMIFGFFTTPAGKEILMEHAAVAGLPAQVFLFPLAALLEMAEAAAAWHVFITARNQNLGKLLDALKKTQKAIIVTAAITLSTIAVVVGIKALAIFVAPLFIIAIGMHALYHAGLFIQSVYKYRRAPKGSALRAHYRKKMITNGVRTVVGVVLTLVIAALFLLAVSTGVGLAVVAGVGIVAVVGAVTASVVLNKCAAAEANSDLAKTATVKTALTKAATNEQVYEATVEEGKGHTDDYYYVRNLSRLLEVAKTQGSGALQETFIKIIDEKKDRLTVQMKASNDPHGFFQQHGRRENQKRLQKINALEDLKKLFTQRGGHFSETELDVIIDKHPGIFQSFFKDKGDVEVIFDTAREYYVTQPRLEQQAMAKAF